MKQSEQPLVNRVAKSGIATLDLSRFYPEFPIESFDLKEYLFKGLILREKEFRSALEEHDWSSYDGKALAIYCSSDAIIPRWAYMLVARYAAGHAQYFHVGSPEDLLGQIMIRNFNNGIDPTEYENKPVVIKGCGDREVPPSVYVHAVQAALPYASKIMYGEPCSTVPVYSKRKAKRSFKN